MKDNHHIADDIAFVRNVLWVSLNFEQQTQ